MAISNIMQFEAVLGDVTKLVDKVSHAQGVNPKFEESRRMFHEMVRVLKNKETPSKIQVQKFTKACDAFISQYGHVQELADKLYDMQDYYEYNPPA